MSASALTPWRPVYDPTETVEQFAARQRQAFVAFELAWRAGRVSSSSKATTIVWCVTWVPMRTPGGRRSAGRRGSGWAQHDQAGAAGADDGRPDPAGAAVRIIKPDVLDRV